MVGSELAKAIVAAVLAVVLAITSIGCAGTTESVRNNPKTAIGAGSGMVGGAAIAALAGAGAGWIVGAAALGALFGGAVGKSLDERDKRLAAEAHQRSLEYGRTGQTQTWTNPDTGHSGSITPTRTYQNASGQYCREYTQNIQIDGQTHQGHGTACRQPDGSWRMN
jgi:surface antigen